MKEMLIIEEPESCETCPLRSYSNLQLMCTPMRESASDVECPLKSLPQKKEVEVDEFEDIKLFSIGWNACIDEILGEEE